MKILKTALFTLFAAVLLQASSADASQQYRISLRASIKTTNDLGDIITVLVNSAGIVRDCALEHSMDPATLALIYDKDTEEVLVVHRASGTNVCVVLQFEDDVSIPNAAGTRVERYVKITDPVNDILRGRATGTIRITRDPLGNLLTFKFGGKFFAKVDETKTERARIYSGTFSTGSRFTLSAP